MDNLDKILGEAAYQILVRREKINVVQLNIQLRTMADEAASILQKQAIFSAIDWLHDYRPLSSGEPSHHSPVGELIQGEHGISLIGSDCAKSSD
ncbi:hypothetical protein PRCB_04435 [Pantoea rodasii]|uniref:Uncharacterized protein n=1 Tax=Pantoea rodasii TaxID=1076549 RepID=A0A2M9WEJ5_9GAMM|nr:hypothetical protein [Pantoea rodasii]ORM57765.1 hypothetical protein HA45_26310 [Pantoea rodasii]PJZ05980.1 hypothetical protein PRCB_04435 [Pantoea rodasii]